LAFAFRRGYVEPVTLAYAHGFHETLGTDSFRAMVGGTF
jgi:hypothetical protein